MALLGRAGPCQQGAKWSVLGKYQCEVTRRRCSRKVAEERRARVMVRSEAASSSSASTSRATSAFTQLERVISTNTSSRDDSNVWDLVEGSWVLRPRETNAKPNALIHFVGGAFVSASPQFTYRHFLETLAFRHNFVVVATPFETNFEHLRLADEIRSRYRRTIDALKIGPDGSMIGSLPVIRIGHSLGALIHLLICSRCGIISGVNAPGALGDGSGEFALGNVLISFNNKPVTEAIPLYTDVISPATSQFLAPLLRTISKSPQAKVVEELTRQVREQTPEQIQQLFPLIDQLQPIYDDIANDRIEFNPTPEESKRILLRKYSVSKNMLVKFTSDIIDETSILSDILQNCEGMSRNAESPGAGNLDMTVRILDGDHATPVRQPVPDDMNPTQIASAMASQGSELFGAFADMVTPSSSDPMFNEVIKNVREGVDSISTNLQEQLTATAATDQVDDLAREITLWAGFKTGTQLELPGQ